MELLAACCHQSNAWLPRPARSPKVTAYLAEHRFHERVERALQQVLKGESLPSDPVRAVAEQLCKPETPAFCNLFLSPPQQQLELSATNQYSWPGATEQEERRLYRATFALLQHRGLSEALLNELRAASSEERRLTPFLGGNIPLNYYLVHRFHAPALVPSNDIDIKVDFGEHMRTLLVGRGGSPAGADKESWSDDEQARVKQCFDEALALFVEFAKQLLERMRKAVEKQLPVIKAELEPLGFKVGPKGVHVFHKTHAAGRDGKPPLNLVPLSGGVFQLMVELTFGKHAFIWNVVDLEADWKSAKPGSKAFPTELVDAKAPVPERSLRLLAPDELRKDLEPSYQKNKETRRKYKREYWDWAARAHAEQQPRSA